MINGLKSDKRILSGLLFPAYFNHVAMKWIYCNVKHAHFLFSAHGARSSSISKPAHQLFYLRGSEGQNHLLAVK